MISLLTGLPNAGAPRHQPPGRPTGSAGSAPQSLALSQTAASDLYGGGLRGG